jgi:hypothetical protein
VRPLLKQAGIPSRLIVNDTAESAFAFVEERRKVKLAHLAGKKETKS